MHSGKLDPIGHRINLEGTRLMHPQMEAGYLATVEVTNMSELMEKFEQMMHMLEQVRKRVCPYTSEMIKYDSMKCVCQE